MCSDILLLRLERRQVQAAQPLEHLSRLVDLRAYGCRLGARAVQMVLHHLNGRLSRLVRPILVEDVMHVDEERAQVLDLGLGVGGTARQGAGQLEEVEQQRLGQALELKGPVVVLGVFGAGGTGCGQVFDALLLESWELVVELQMGIELDGDRGTMQEPRVKPYHVLIAKDSPPSICRLWRWLQRHQMPWQIRDSHMVALLIRGMSPSQLFNGSNVGCCKFLPEIRRVWKRRGQRVRLLLLIHVCSVLEALLSLSSRFQLHVTPPRALSKCR